MLDCGATQQDALSVDRVGSLQNVRTRRNPPSPLLPRSRRPEPQRARPERLPSVIIICEAHGPRSCAYGVNVECERVGFGFYFVGSIFTPP
jgi:hypothetical protein